MDEIEKIKVELAEEFLDNADPNKVYGKREVLVSLLKRAVFRIESNELVAVWSGPLGTITARAKLTERARELLEKLD